MHWYKWEAYWTWLTGFVLLVVLYYLQADTALIDPSVADLSTWEAVVISLGGLALAWVVYDALCRTVGRHSEPALAACVLGLTMLSAWGASQLFAPRAAYLQVGAMLGTIMAANVFFVIIPAHRELVRAKEQGREPDPDANRRGKQRSVHNNYLTLPVLFTMIAAHFPFTYGHDDAWAMLVCLMVIGACDPALLQQPARRPHALVDPGRGSGRHRGHRGLDPAHVEHTRRRLDDGYVRAGSPDRRRALRRLPLVAPDARRQPRRSASSSTPLRRSTREAARIKVVAVDTHVMPLGNATHMTDAERALLGAWIAAGAKTP